MSELAAIKALSKETKALILVSEFEARRMPVFQLRMVLELLVTNPQEQKLIVDLVESDLRASGYPADEVSAFLSALLKTVPPQPVSPEGSEVTTTRRLRSPFALDFEGGVPPADAEVVSAERGKPAPPVAPRPPNTSIVPGQGLVGIVQHPPLPTGPSLFGHGKHIVAGPPRDVPSTASSAPVPSVPQGTPKPRPSTIISGVAPPAPAQPPFFGKGRTSMMGPFPADAPAPPQPPFPGATPPAVPGTEGKRRGTFAYPSPAAPPATGPAEPVPQSPDTMMPVGQKVLRRHEMAFGGKEPAATSPLASKPLIVIADDDKRARMIFRIRIEEAGYEVLECGTGDEAWERIREGGAALAVLDMKMPGLHGLEVLSNIANKFPGMPVVICTAYDQLQEEFAVQTYPRLKYLVKPIAPEALVQAIKELLGAKSTA